VTLAVLPAVPTLSGTTPASAVRLKAPDRHVAVKGRDG
jgi:hypothetical protein